MNPITTRERLGTAAVARQDRADATGAATDGLCTAASVVLAIDFAGRRDEATLQDLYLEGTGFAVRYLCQDRPPAGWSCSEYAAELLAGVDEPVAAVLGYCGSASLALTVAAAIPETVTCVLFDPVVVSIDDVRDSAVEVGATFGVPEHAIPAAALLDSDPCRWLSGVTAMLRDGAEQQLRADGATGAELADDVEFVTAHYTRWLHHQLITARAPDPHHPEAVVVRSAAGTAYPGHCVAHRLDVSASDLLRHQATRTLLGRLLRRAPHREPTGGGHVR